MPETLRLLAILAHPDDESLGLGGVFARYAAEGVETYAVTATRGQSGRYGEHRSGPEHPGPEKLGEIREAELREAVQVLGIRELVLLDHVDKHLDEVDPSVIVPEIAAAIRRIRPHVVLTFPPDGAYGHPDHIAISQFAQAAVVAAADAAFVADAPGGGAAKRDVRNHPPHRVSKLYYFAWPKAAWDAYESVVKKLVSVVDGVERQSHPWPDWAITTVIDTREHWETAWKAVSCHRSQMAVYQKLHDLAPEHHEGIWGWQYFYRVFSFVNGGRAQETDLFEGLR